MDRKGILLLLLIGFVGLMDALDGTIVSVALPSIAIEMGVDIASASLVSVTYFMMMAGLLILFGRIAKNTSIRLILLSGIGVFTISSLACGLSVNFPMLVASRIAQGIGASMMGATMPMCCVRFFKPQDLGFALSIITIGYSVGAAMGPALGGVIIDTLSWSWVFFINIPVGILLIALLHFYLPEESRLEEKAHLDLLGAFTLFVAIVGLVVFIENIGEPLTMIPSASLFVIFILTFVHNERKVDNPLLDLSIFGQKAFNLNLLTYFLLNVVYMGLVYLLPFYMMICFGFDGGMTGLFLFIPPLVTMLTGVPVGRWSDNTGRRGFSIASCMMLFASMTILAFLDSLIVPLFLVALAMMGLMWTFAGGPLCSRIIESTEGESKEIGSTMVNESGYLGSTIGAVLFAGMFSSIAGVGGVAIEMLSKDVFMTGFTATMFIGASISLIAAILAFVVREDRRSA